MGRRRKGRNVHGIMLLDKPAGVTSNHALQRVRRLLDARKAGHTGSLDPLATGLLPLCFGEATKVSAFLLDADKRYRVTARFGCVTDTGDAEGEVVAERPVIGLDRDTLGAAMVRFEGAIEQVPPMYSALKHEGRRLYELAREGREVERPPRPVTIHELRLLAIDGDTATLEVACSKGTYVRTLVEDIGEAVGPGAHVTALRRTALGPFRDEAALVTLPALETLDGDEGRAALEQRLIPMEQALGDWPDIHLSGDLAAYVRQGQPVWVPRAPGQGWVRLFAEGERFLGMGTVLDDGRIAPKRLVATG
ncbi:tRNA pseudouridine synthase B [wastewater metagenome]|uniref:tRNA pseudouridine(55) synthase n=3 Tax=root TaxID=1 RepID=A0A5B8R829_9ZZZZ|nr:tRNA pseudouridine(55) synthase TruB [Arhodomonas aquaeolei]QEA04073.1 tRNA pseudouridine synthase B [uncultured organism]